MTQLEKVSQLKEKRIQEENQARQKLDKIHKKKIAAADKERSDRLEEARKSIEKKLREEEEIRFKEEKGSNNCNRLLSADTVTAISGLELGGMKRFSGEIKPFSGMSIVFGAFNLNLLP